MKPFLVILVLVVVGVVTADPYRDNLLQWVTVDAATVERKVNMANLIVGGRDLDGGLLYFCRSDNGAHDTLPGKYNHNMKCCYLPDGKELLHLTNFQVLVMKSPSQVRVKWERNTGRVPVGAVNGGHHSRAPLYLARAKDLTRGHNIVQVGHVYQNRLHYSWNYKKYTMEHFEYLIVESRVKPTTTTTTRRPTTRKAEVFKPNSPRYMVTVQEQPSCSPKNVPSNNNLQLVCTEALKSNAERNIQWSNSKMIDFMQREGGIKVAFELVSERRSN